jgi:hypothetical protein
MNFPKYTDLRGKVSKLYDPGGRHIRAMMQLLDFSLPKCLLAILATYSIVCNRAAAVTNCGVAAVFGTAPACLQATSGHGIDSRSTDPVKGNRLYCFIIAKE